MIRFLRLVSVYLDFITALMFIGLAAYFVPQIAEFGFLVHAAISFILSLALAAAGLSPGQWLTAEIAGMVAAPPWPRRILLNLGLGVYAYLEATKQFVRWTLMDRPMPFMGAIPEGVQQIGLSLAFGAVFMITGILLLRLHQFGKWIGLGLTGVLIASNLVSWPVYPEAIKRMVEARRAVQGLPVREGEIEMMQAFFPAFSLGLLVVIAVALLFCRSKRNGTDQGA